MSDFEPINLSKYNVSNIIYSDVIKKELKTTNKDGKEGAPIEFKRILISNRHSNGNTGDLILKTPNDNHFCFGVQDFCNADGKVSYSLSFSLYDRDVKTEQQQEEKDRAEEWMECVLKLIIHGLDHLKNLVKLGKLNDKVGQTRISSVVAEDLSPIKIRDKDGNLKHPIFSAKLMERITGKDKETKIVTIFDDINGNEINPLDLKKVYSKIDAAIKYESIFIGQVLAFQFKIYQVVLDPISSVPKRILPHRRTITDNSIEDYKHNSDNPILGENDVEKLSLKDNNEHIENSDDEEIQPVKTVKRKTTKKVKSK